MLDGVMDMSSWLVGWLELMRVDRREVISMAPMVSLGFIIWWVIMHLGPLGLDELEGNDDGESSKPSKEENQMDFDNPIHDEHLPIGGLEVLVVVSLA